MGKIDSNSIEGLSSLRKILHKQGLTLVRNKKTGRIHYRKISTEPVAPPTPDQVSRRNAFSQRSIMAATWLKENNPQACPPDGTPEYQDMLQRFKRQDKVKQLLNFVMSNM